ncbi:MAG: hypothetical protein HRF50_01815 [Phycisphaerae bacterium]|jgi:hypothetical protein
MLLTSGAAIADQDQCYHVTQDYEQCPDCGGNSVCFCLYDGAACPSADVFCATRNTIATGGNDSLLATQVVCSTYRQCQSTLGGPCHPETNKCKKVGIQQITMWWRYETDVGPCIPH